MCPPPWDGRCPCVGWVDSYNQEAEAGEREPRVIAAADSPNIVGSLGSGMHMNERMVVASRS